MKIIKNKKFIKITRGSTEYFGGNQSWWEKENQAMKEYGCGVISMCNLELYVDGVSRKGITYGQYKAYVNKRYRENYSLGKSKRKQSIGLLPTTMEKGLDKFYSDRNIDPIISWCPTVSRKRIRQLIEKMLDNNIPIVASYYVFNKRNKLDLYTYNESDGSFEKNSSIRRHYFNIVGITERNGKDLLIISTWGGKYYAYYDKWVKKLSLFSNILYVE